MRIGDLAAECGVSTQTIRFYEKRRLMPEPHRSPNGYRIYDRASVERVAFIRRAQSAGLTLAEIGGVLPTGRPRLRIRKRITGRQIDPHRTYAR